VTGWLIFGTWFVIHWAVAFKLMPVYYRRWYDDSKRRWTYNTEQEHQRSGAWHAVGLAFVWPWYEGLRWVRDTIIHRMTAEERAAAEYEKAQRIVDEYRANKEREEREAFDRELGE
jgi:hypothetical protein